MFSIANKYKRKKDTINIFMSSGNMIKITFLELSRSRLPKLTQRSFFFFNIYRLSLFFNIYLFGSTKVLAAYGISKSQHVGSGSLIRGRTPAPHIGNMDRQSSP